MINDQLLDQLWEEAAGEFDFGGIRMLYNVRPNMTKEEWKRKYLNRLCDNGEFAISKEGKIIMPKLGIF